MKEEIRSFGKVAKPLVLWAACVLMLLGGGTAQAATLIITDNQEPPPPTVRAVTRFEAFGTTLSASVINPPQATAEIEVTGPSYQWSGGGSDLHLTSNSGVSVGLESGFPPSYSGAGQKSVTVNCTASYTRTDQQTGKTLSPITVSGSKSVKFFVRVPVEARNISANPVRGTVHPWSGIGIGHDVTYDFICLDNQSPPQGYGNGKISEKFSGYSPNPAYAQALTSYPGAPGEEKTFGPAYTWSDRNRWNTYGWDIVQPGSEAATASAGPDDLWFSFVQTFHCLEQVPPYNTTPPPPYDQDTSLTPSYTVTHHRDYVERH